MRAIMFEFSAALRNAQRAGDRELDIETICYSIEALAYYNWQFGSIILTTLERDLVLDTIGLCDMIGPGHFTDDCEVVDCANAN